MINKPPNWRKVVYRESFLSKALSSDELKELVRKANKDYAYWDTFKYYPIPGGFTSEEAWGFLKLMRGSDSEKTPIRAIDDSLFTFTITKSMYSRISIIDKNTSGFLTSDDNKPNTTERNRLIISGLTEEAIASSQIEGANTSRKVAKEMLLTNRKARTRDEQMIINNYQVMQRLMDWQQLPLSIDMLLEIQNNITVGTLEDENDSGRLRTDEDNIEIVNRLTGETIFIPPSTEFVAEELKKLVEYANAPESEDEFVHPVIKASILHFWIAYLHPFVDGNGRTARAIFYWYMLKRNYWMFQYLSVSRIIKKSKSKYDAAYLYSEYDNNDLTYFLAYKLRAICLSIEEFIDHYQNKMKKEKHLEKIAVKLGQYNERQVDLLQDLNLNKEKTIHVNEYKTKYRVSYETARSDLSLLVKKNLLSKVLSGRKYIYIPNTAEISKLLTLVTERLRD